MCERKLICSLPLVHGAVNQKFLTRGTPLVPVPSHNHRFSGCILSINQSPGTNIVPGVVGAEQVLLVSVCTFFGSSVGCLATERYLHDYSFYIPYFSV